MRTLSYRVILRKEPEGGYTVLVPMLPGCVTYGKTVEEAIEMAKDAIRLYVESLIEDGVSVPVEEELIESVLVLQKPTSYSLRSPHFFTLAQFLTADATRE